MSRTYRNVPQWVAYPGTFGILNMSVYRTENHKARDGSGYHWFCGSSVEGKMNNWDDVGCKIRRPHKQARQFFKRDLCSRLVENEETLKIEAAELEEEIRRQDDWAIGDDCWDDCLEEQRYNSCKHIEEAEAEREYERDCAEECEANRYLYWDSLDLDFYYYLD